MVNYFLPYHPWSTIFPSHELLSLTHLKKDSFPLKHQLITRNPPLKSPGLRVTNWCFKWVTHQLVSCNPVARAKRRIHISKVRNYMFNQWYPITMSLPNCYLHEMEQLGKDIGNGYPLVKHVIPYWCVSSFTCLLNLGQCARVTNLMLTQVIQVRRLGSQAPSYLNYLCQH